MWWPRWRPPPAYLPPLPYSFSKCLLSPAGKLRSLPKVPCPEHLGLNPVLALLGVGGPRWNVTEYAQRDPAWSGRHIHKHLWCASSALDSSTDGGLPLLDIHQGPDISHALHIHQLISSTITLWSSYNYKLSHFTDKETEAKKCAFRSKSI